MSKKPNSNTTSHTIKPEISPPASSNKEDNCYSLLTWFLHKNVFDVHVLTDLMYGRSNIVPIIGTLRKKLTATGKKPL